MALLEKWGQAVELQERLQDRCRSLKISVYYNYDPDQDREEFFINARHPRTNELRFRRLVPKSELATKPGIDLLFAQLFLVEPSPTPTNGG